MFVRAGFHHITTSVEANHGSICKLACVTWKLETSGAHTLKVYFSEIGDEMNNDCIFIDTGLFNGREVVDVIFCVEKTH